jgi:hypothetical protein
MAARVTFVGREGELSRLQAALGGDARLVLVVGDAGGRQDPVLWARGWPGPRAAGMVMVRGEAGRLVPGLGPGAVPGPGGRDKGWQRERQFSAVAELLAVVARSAGCRIGLVVEDVHWADGATLDLQLPA